MFGRAWKLGLEFSPNSLSRPRILPTASLVSDLIGSEIAWKRGVPLRPRLGESFAISFPRSPAATAEIPAGCRRRRLQISARENSRR
jgi:hypothetical protein